MRIITLSVLLKIGDKAIFLKQAEKLDFMAFLKRRMARGPLAFGARTVASNLKMNQYVRVEHAEVENTYIYGNLNGSNVAAIIIADSEYPEPAAVKILQDIQLTFAKAFDPSALKLFTSDQDLNFPFLEQMINKY